MLSVTEKRRARIINIVYFAIMIAIFYFAFTSLSSLIMPFFYAFIVAALFNKPVTKLTKKTPLKKRSLWSVIFVLLLLAAVFGVFFLVGVELFKKIREFFDYILGQLQNTEVLFNNIKLWILDATSFLPAGIKSSLHTNVSDFFDNLARNGLENVSVDTSGIDWGNLLSKGGEMLSGTVAKIPSFMIAFVVFVISCVFILSDYERLKGFVFRQLSDENATRIRSAVKLGSSCLKKMCKAYGLIILITTFELSVGFYLLRIFKVFNGQYIFLLAFGIALIDIIPVLGTGTVLIPWAVISFFSKDFKLGIGLIVMYVIILVIRQIIEPKLVAGQVGLPPIVTIIAMYIGSKTLGILGFFILPFVVILVKVFNDEGIIHIFKTAKEKESCEKTVADTAEIKETADDNL